MIYKKKIFILIFSFFSFGIFAQPLLSPKNPQRQQPRRQQPKFFLEDSNEEFLLLNVKVSDRNFSKIDSKENCITIDFVFNKILNPNSIKNDSVLISRKTIDLTNIHFSKRGNHFRLILKNPPEIFDLTIQNIKSQDGKKIKSIFIEKVCEDFKLHETPHIPRKNEVEKCPKFL